MTTTASPSPTTDRVRATLRLQFGAALDDIADDDLLRDGLGDRYDSVTALECVCRIESEFGIAVDFVDHDIRYSFSTIARIRGYVRDRLEDNAVLDRFGE